MYRYVYAYWEFVGQKMSPDKHYRGKRTRPSIRGRRNTIISRVLSNYYRISLLSRRRGKRAAARMVARWTRSRAYVFVGVHGFRGTSRSIILFTADTRTARGVIYEISDVITRTRFGSGKNGYGY